MRHYALDGGTRTGSFFGEVAFNVLISSTLLYLSPSRTTCWLLPIILIHEDHKRKTRCLPINGVLWMIICTFAQPTFSCNMYILTYCNTTFGKQWLGRCDTFPLQFFTWKTSVTFPFPVILLPLKQILFCIYRKKKRGCWNCFQEHLQSANLECLRHHHQHWKLSRQLQSLPSKVLLGQRFHRLPVMEELNPVLWMEKHHQY